MLNTNSNTRTIGTFEGEIPGPRIIAISAIHGNEPAGVRALEMVFKALKQERSSNPAFQFRGKLLGMIGNLQAFQLNQRFLEQDLNRMWAINKLDEINASTSGDLTAESREVRDIFDYISVECQSSTTEPTVFIDLHTTSAEGGVFSIPTDEADSLVLAKHLGAPAIIGLQGTIPGTLLGFAATGGFSTQSPATLPICIAFEAGQHESPHAISLTAHAIVQCLRTMGNIEQNGLAEFSESLHLPLPAYVPPVVRFIYAHHIAAEDKFKMRPGYVNFQPVQQGEHLADDRHGPVLSPDKGLILMPLYQARGSDGFFIVQ